MFTCCPGHPYSYPDYYFTPLTCQWQRPDFRPLQFEHESRSDYKVGQCGQYKYVTRVAVAPFDAGNEEQAKKIESLANDLCIDRIYVIVTSKESKYAFIRRFMKNFRVRNKVVRTYMRTSNNKECLRSFAQRFLQGELTILA